MERSTCEASSFSLVRFACLALAALAALAPVCLAEPLRVDSLQNDKKVYPEIQEGRNKLSRMDLDGALASFEAAAKAHPDLSSGRVLMGTILLKSGRVREGRAQLEKAIIETPSDPEPYLIFGDVAFNEGRYTESALAFERAFQLTNAFKGNDTKKTDFMKRALTGVALGAEMHEQWPEAQKYLQALIKIDPTLGMAHFRMGRIKFELKNPDDAYAELEAAARQDEKVPSPEVTMAKFYLGAKDRDNADKFMEKAVARAPKDKEKEAKTRLEVAQFYLETNRIAEAKAQAELAVKLTPDVPDALFMAGVTSRFSRDYAKAVGYLEKAYLKAPGSLNVSNQLALAQSEMGEEPTQHALALAETAMKQNPNSAEAAATLGWLYYKVGKLDDAERLLRAATVTANIQPDTAYFLARLADARNRGDSVKPLLDAALKSEAPFAYREEAQKLSDQLNKRPVTADATPGKSTTPEKGTTPGKSATPASKTTEPTGPSKSGPSKSAPDPKAAPDGKTTPPAKAPPAKAPPAKSPTAAPEAPK